ncbi:hypothetical protein EKG37_02175 [Robertmurraya yapensis]|uniref:Uncharacterized protein n=1 Tax=Bacillus yapensis TaxID=2492960 RepID=A0A431WLQ8_9BACI|nr:hypothetical protein [Bacillus yapensis]RTR36386.1 hypothetical protein EKG37_02175 [Bacillus yapensis]TKT05890.1 hypothetical protein FAR12_02175 [Bacillus yapensis]
MFGIFVDYIGKRIIYANTVHIEVLDKLTKDVASCESFKGMSENEMNLKLFSLKEKNEDFEVIGIGDTFGNLEH